MSVCNDSINETTWNTVPGTGTRYWVPTSHLKKIKCFEKPITTNNAVNMVLKLKKKKEYFLIKVSYI